MQTGNEFPSLAPACRGLSQILGTAVPSLAPSLAPTQPRPFSNLAPILAGS